MSAPQTNVEKQAKNHKGPLVGIIAAVVFAGVLLLGLILWLSANGNTPEGADIQIDGRTGAEIVQEEGTPVAE